MKINMEMSFFFLSCFVKCVYTYLGMMNTVLNSGTRKAVQVR